MKEPVHTWHRPIRVCMIYLPVLAAIFAWYWIASYGGRPDASPFRSVLYLTYFLILPAGIAAFLIHLFATLGTKGTLKWRFLISAGSGFLGLLALHLMIRSSPDGEAAMAYFAAAIAFCCFAVAGFCLSTIAFWLHRLAQKKKPNKSQHPSA